MSKEIPIRTQWGINYKALVTCILLGVFLNTGLGMRYYGTTANDGSLASQPILAETLLDPLESLPALSFSPSRCDTDSPPSSIHMEFHFTPSRAAKPFKRRAVITLFSANESRREYDTHFADVLVLAHSFAQHHASEEYEFVVAFTGRLSHRKQQSLQSLGARLLPLRELNPTSETNATNPLDSYKPCIACFTKLFLFGLEDYYSDILFLESTLLLRNTTLLLPSLFSHLHTPTTFAAVPSLGQPPSTLDTAVLLFKPSLTRMHKLLAYAPQFYNSYYNEQSLLSQYFSGPQSPSCTHWTRLPDAFNLQHPSLRDAHQIAHAEIIQHTFWPSLITTPSTTTPTTKKNRHTSGLHTLWKHALHETYTTQLSHTGKSDVSLVPESDADLSIMLRANTWATRTVIYSILTEKRGNSIVTRVVGNRARYCARHPGCFTYLRETTHPGTEAVWMKAYDARFLIEQYDFVWLLDARDAFIMNGEVDVRVMLGKLILEHPDVDPDVIIARDFNDMNAGSFFLRSSEWTRSVFMPEWIADEKLDLFQKEQTAIIEMFRDNEHGIRRHLVDVPQEKSTLFNGYYFGPGKHYEKGDFVLHAPSRGYWGLSQWLEENNQTEFRRRRRDDFVESGLSNRKESEALFRAV
ncbi:hypothetical protein HDU98_000932, partial [Podochytrium sp. JEL0797]